MEVRTRLILILVIVTFAASAETSELVVSTGKQDGGYWDLGQRLKQVAAERNLAVAVVESKGSLENLERLNDTDSDVSVALVQADALQYYLNKHPELLPKLQILESIGQECVFIIAGAGSGIDEQSDLQDRGERRIAISSPDSGVAVTYEYMALLQPAFRNTTVMYMDTMEALSQLSAEQDSSVSAVMLVQHPKVRSPEIKLAISHPQTYQFVRIDDPRLEARLPNGEPVYSFLDIPLVRQGYETRLSIETICTEGLLIAEKNKLSGPARDTLSKILDYDWMRVYTREQ